MHNQFNASAYSGTYDPAETNIYYRLCQEMNVNIDSCLNIFEEFGLDPENFFSTDEKVNLCP
ncbi:hypothetical protein KKA47_02820 [bacterium]|nr:hypothetical protein [bacterium]